MSNSKCELCGQEKVCKKCTPKQLHCLTYWPSTQLCMECKHGKFINEEGGLPATYICSIGVDLGPCEVRCEMQELK